jgi:hypothetical protein
MKASARNSLPLMIVKRNTVNGHTGITSLFGDSENRGKNYLKIRDLLSIVLFNILGTHYSIHI